MTIVILCPHFEDTGGVREVVGRLAAEHVKGGHRVEILSRVRSSESGVASLPPGVGVHRLPMAAAPYRGAGWRAARQFGRRFARGAVPMATQLRRIRPDVVAVHCSKFYAPWVVVARLAVRAPVVAHLHNAERTADGPPSPFWSKRLLGAARHVIAVSSAVADYAVALRPALAGHVTVIRNGIDPAEGAWGDSETRDVPYVLAVGRLAHQKGFDVLLDAAARVSLPMAVVIAGTGPDAETLRQQADCLGLASRVEFLGDVPRDRVRALLRGAAVVAMPSRFEGNPLVALEAMQAGAPFVASDIPGLPEEMLHGVSGLIVPPEDPSALAAAIEHLLSDRVAAEAYGRSAAAAAMRMPSWEMVGARVLTVYETVAHST